MDTKPPTQIAADRWNAQADELTPWNVPGQVENDELISASDPLQPLLEEAMRRMLLEEYGPITWVIGQEWVVHHGAGSWSIGPDEPATKDQVRDLLIRSAGIFELQDY
ncbi:hypothetical protein HX798_21555 [Pseudomonas putida]|uniref:Uncharacterized protein n=1 Tax=Pseudomonas putida TaxID=303 RepID=A0A7Y7ZDL9_PSEPU|nr:hypothetical protein [Pseudomonas putida]NWC82855.1 hypothetical protein [Pseudomonas putida]